MPQGVQQWQRFYFWLGLRWFNGVSLACGWWPSTERLLGSFVISSGSRPVVLLLLTWCWLLLPLLDSVIILCFVVRYIMSILVFNHLDGEESTGCFTLFVFLVSRDCCVAPPHDATALSAVCDCGISWSYSVTVLLRNPIFLWFFRVVVIWNPCLTFRIRAWYSSCVSQHSIYII